MISLPLYLLVINLITYLLYWHDKRAAQRGGWRVSEFILLLAGFIGGSIAAFLAQRICRHKTRKRSFQFAFWALVVVQGALLYYKPFMLQHIAGRLFHL